MISDVGSVGSSYGHALWMSTRTCSNVLFVPLLTGNVELGLLPEGFQLYLVHHPRLAFVLSSLISCVSYDYVLCCVFLVVEDN
jgi:hypothetical protein